MRSQSGQNELDGVPDLVAEVTVAQDRAHVQADVVTYGVGGRGHAQGWGQGHPWGWGRGPNGPLRALPWTLWEHRAMRRASVPHSGMPWGNWRRWRGDGEGLGGDRDRFGGGTRMGTGPTWPSAATVSSWGSRILRWSLSWSSWKTGDPTINKGDAVVLSRRGPGRVSRHPISGSVGVRGFVIVGSPRRAGQRGVFL